MILAVLSVVLFVISGEPARPRGRRRQPAPYVAKETGRSRQPRALPKARQPPGPLADDGIDDEIAEILKRRGIS